MRSTAAAAAIAAATCAATFAFGGNAVGGPPDSQAQSVRQGVKGAIEKTSAWTEAAIDWMAQKSDRVKDKANHWRSAAEEKLKAAVDDALSLPPAPTGVRLLAIHDSTSGRPSWLPIDDVPVKLPVRMVLLVHGLDEPGDVWDDLAPMLRDDGHAVAKFDYADDQPCLASADELSSGLRQLRGRGVERVDLVCHSMGGLVAREVLTRDGLYGGDASAARLHGELPAVARLIMIGTPNQGSCLARLRFVAEAREHLMRWLDSDGKDPRHLLGFLKDGAGEAGTDLCPDSPFIVGLNARALPTNVRITNIVGTMAGGQVAKFEELLRSDWVRKVLDDEQIAKLWAAVEAAMGVLGDGVVTVDSAMLPGIEDTVRVCAMHRTIVKRPMGEDTLKDALGEPRQIPSAVPVIMDRLKRP